jgi:hypothetical protein
MRYGILFSSRGPRPYLSASLSPHRRTKDLTPGESVAFAALFMFAVVVTIVVVLIVL